MKVFKNWVTLCLFMIIACACKNDGVTLIGILEKDHDLEKILLRKGSETIQEIVFNKGENDFKFNLEAVESGYYRLGKHVIYLAPGFDLTADFTQDTLRFKGKGSDENNFLQERIKRDREYHPLNQDVNEKYQLSQDEFDSYLEKDVFSWHKERIEGKALNEHFKEVEKKGAESLKHVLKLQYYSDHGTNRELMGKAFAYLNSNGGFDNPNTVKVFDSMMASSRKDAFPSEFIEKKRNAIDAKYDINNEALYTSNSLGYQLILNRKVEKGGFAYKIADSLKTQKPSLVYQHNFVLDSIKNKTIKGDFLTRLTEIIIKAEPEYAEESYALFINEGPLLGEQQITKVSTVFDIFKKLKKGAPSPKFIDYRTPEEENISLEDFSGKYVYIDVWATWCGPCIQEIPSLKKLEKEYHSKNIQFVSISVDNEKQRQDWKKMVLDKELTGVQIMADKSFESEFIAGYNIASIPRFLLIAPDGTIENSDAPRPSDPALITLLESLDI